jgi:hypothetical protein
VPSAGFKLTTKSLTAILTGFWMPYASFCYLEEELVKVNTHLNIVLPSNASVLHLEVFWQKFLCECIIMSPMVLCILLISVLIHLIILITQDWTLNIVLSLLMFSLQFTEPDIRLPGLLVRPLFL